RNFTKLVLGSVETIHQIIQWISDYFNPVDIYPLSVGSSEHNNRNNRFNPTFTSLSCKIIPNKYMYKHNLKLLTVNGNRPEEQRK
ncbi:11947_t:CDS:2, partial [Ambispora leptoticha]